MHRKIVKVLTILNILFCNLFLTSCYKKERFLFQEGRYEYFGEQFSFYDDVKISSIFLNFVLTDKDKEDQSIIMNRKNKEYYYVDFCFKNDKNKCLSCSFENQGKVGNQIDRYYIKLDVSDLIKKDNSFLMVYLEFYDSDYYLDKSKNSNANLIYITAISLTIEEENITNYFFPARMQLSHLEEM